MQRSIQVVIIGVLLVMATSATASVVLDSGLIKVDAKGSLNTIVGFGHIDDDQLLDVAVGSTIESFELEYLGTETTPSVGNPRFFGLHFNYNVLALTFPSATIGQTQTVLTNEQGAWVLMGYVRDSGTPEPSLVGSFTWSVGGIDAIATSTFELRAIGQLAPTSVPEPTTLALLCLSLAGLGFSSCKR